MPNKPTLSVVSANKVPNQPPFAMQLEISALLQQDLARVLRILPTQVSPEDLIIQNVVRGKPKARDRNHPRRSRGQRQEHIDRDYIGRGQLID